MKKSSRGNNLTPSIPLLSPDDATLLPLFGPQLGWSQLDA